MIRLGVVGYGRRIHGVVEHNLRALEPDLAVVGIVDPDERGVRGRLSARDRGNAVFYPDLPTLVRRGEARRSGCRRARQPACALCNPGGSIRSAVVPGEASGH